MPVRIVEYQFARELTPLLKEASAESRNRQYFVVPGTGDRRWLRDVLVGEETFGGGEPPILRWEELYREAAIRMNPADWSLRRQIDPPDHWLIVRHVLESVLEDNPRTENLPPAIGKPGFISMLGTTLRELLREEVLPEHVAASVGCDGCESGESCPADDTPDRLLCRLYHRYSAYLEREGLFDSASSCLSFVSFLSGCPLGRKASSAGKTWIIRQGRFARLARASQTAKGTTPPLKTTVPPPARSEAHSPASVSTSDSVLSKT